MSKVNDTCIIYMYMHVYVLLTVLLKADNNEQQVYSAVCLINIDQIPTDTCY